MSSKGREEIRKNIHIVDIYFLGSVPIISQGSVIPANIEFLSSSDMDLLSDITEKGFPGGYCQYVKGMSLSDCDRVLSGTIALKDPKTGKLRRPDPENGS